MVKYLLVLAVASLYLASALPHGSSDTGDNARGAAATFEPSHAQEQSGLLASWFGRRGLNYNDVSGRERDCIKGVGNGTGADRDTRACKQMHDGDVMWYGVLIVCGFITGLCLFLQCRNDSKLHKCIGGLLPNLTQTAVKPMQTTAKLQAVGPAEPAEPAPAPSGSGTGMAVDGLPGQAE